jgi:DNA-directed RNA polymerase subunit RPC12/RpoP
MPAFVYSCENCSNELRFLVSLLLEGTINMHCPKCDVLRKLYLTREGNVGKDWCRKLVISNKKRRDEDGLYKSPVRVQALAG